MLLKKIESIRKKPKEVQDRYAFWTSFFITFVIGVVWLMSIPARLAVLTNTSIVVQEKDIQGGFSRNFSDMKATLIEGFTVLKNTSEDSVPTVSKIVDQNNTIDFESFFTVSTTPDVIEDKNPAIPVLIATSSKEKSSSTKI